MEEHWGDIIDYSIPDHQAEGNGSNCSRIRANSRLLVHLFSSTRPGIVKMSKMMLENEKGHYLNYH